MGRPPPLWRIALAVPERAAPVFEAALGGFAASLAVMEGGGGVCVIEALADREPDRGRLAAALALAAASSDLPEPDFTVAPLADRDWLAESARSFAPLRVGRFFIHGAGLEGPPPASAIALELEAGLAFGTGRHESTKGCLLALEQLARARRFARPLDLGCGTGILAIAMAKLWAVPVTAADIDPLVFPVARGNARANGCAGLVRVVGGAGPHARGLRARGPFDLVVANILARPLVRLAPALAGALTPRGVAVLSGFLAADEAAVRAAYRAQRFALVRRLAIGDWRTLVLARGRAGPGGCWAGGGRCGLVSGDG